MRYDAAVHPQAVILMPNLEVRLALRRRAVREEPLVGRVRAAHCQERPL